MRAGIIGSNWGLVHLVPLRNAGVDVVALCGQDAANTARVAAREGIGRCHTNAAELQDLDLIVIATPAITHPQLLELFPHQFVICEKPLLGIGHPLARAASLPRQRVWVNYAFAFLDCAQAAAAALAQIGPLQRVRVESTVNIPLTFSWPQWFMEVASHPLSWVLHQLGPAWPRTVRPLPQGHLVEAWWPSGTTGEFVVGHQPQAGIHHRLHLVGEGGSIELQGQLIWGENWRYGPLRVNGEVLELANGGSGDPWVLANHEAVTALVAVARGRTSRDQALASGLFDLDKALWVEQLVGQMAAVPLMTEHGQ
ncbi:MAG: Gfo/Idh/MocA family oxidoreductase [Gammaproteobacteria bacterium]|nr:Gfo/Idh/MocA family oxidoreductase [Gammaproteobacteria bacterium]